MLHRQCAGPNLRRGLNAVLARSRMAPRREDEKGTGRGDGEKRLLREAQGVGESLLNTSSHLLLYVLQHA
ncbi:hypothetical protein DPEC_G00353080 [Dallia pectoralis]|uniref:Uncharacterized protein n=1 Tax=Dallia pectoralis TaxID=75939 RepID=A0ACC2F2J0_DALPE|nr:hypothetical protein DPEC_G00353080 [Dallia pectoralis]